MAIFRVTSRTWNRQAAKATVRYISHRREKEEKTQTRELFGRDGEPLIKYQAYSMIDRWNATFFRLVISPDRKTEDTNQDLNLKTLTENTMMQLQERFPNQTIPYVAAIHTNTDDRHVHILAMIPIKRLPQKDLNLLIKTATNEAQLQRRELDRDIPPQLTALPPARVVHSRPKLPQHDTPANKSWSGKNRIIHKEKSPSPIQKRPSCPNCGPFHEMEGYGRRFECPSCGLRLSRTSIGIEIIRGPGLELSLEGVGEP
jgi:ribosomal protein S27AE